MHVIGAAQYGAWEGLPTANEQISLLAKGIDDRGVLSKCNAVLSGYLGSEEQGGHVIDVVKRVKAANPAALYVCDPVMGHPAKGCVVAQGVQDHHAVSSVGAADVVCPNILELGVLTGLPCNTPKEVLAAARAVLRKGPRLVLVKHSTTPASTPSRPSRCYSSLTAPRGTSNARCCPSTGRRWAPVI